jgi:lipoprotein-anchoring transpeptidase ErfK/SrfK
MRASVVTSLVLLSLTMAVHAAGASTAAGPDAATAPASERATPAPEAPAATDPGPDRQAPAAPSEQQAQPPPAVPTLIADINLTGQTMTVHVSGRETYTWRISSGREGYRTPVGTFRPDWMARMWYSRQYDLAPMPHAVFFKNGAAIHGTSEVGQLGNPASHGCIRLAPANAATFYSLVAKHGLAATRIVVRGTPPAREPRIARGDRRYGEDEFAAARSYNRYGYPNPWGVRSYVPPARYAPYRNMRVSPYWRY